MMVADHLLDSLKPFPVDIAVVRMGDQRQPPIPGFVSTGLTRDTAFITR